VNTQITEPELLYAFARLMSISSNFLFSYPGGERSLRIVRSWRIGIYDSSSSCCHGVYRPSARHVHWTFELGRHWHRNVKHCPSPLLIYSFIHVIRFGSRNIAYLPSDLLCSGLFVSFFQL